MKLNVLRNTMLITCFLALTGCGLVQSVGDGTAEITQSIFYKKIKVLHLDFKPRAAMNSADDQIPLATMVRVYQLKDSKNVDTADYQSMLNNSDELLKDDLLDSKSILVMPEGSVNLDMPMHEEALFVAVVALFNKPDVEKNTWRIVIPLNDLEPDDPRVIELGKNALTLVPLED